MADVSEDVFEAAKRASAAQLLLKAGRLVNERALSQIPQEPGQWRMRPSHTALFPHLEFAGTRITVLAERLGISKQAVSQLVGDLERMGVLQRIPDPSDGRAKLVVFAEDGPTLLMKGMRYLQTVDAELEELLGPRRLASLRKILIEVIEELEERSSMQPSRDIEGR
ncbi:MAG: MarR family winged helix-turn-helix transcriptional regulator [Sandaracinaceae bacterium]